MAKYNWDTARPEQESIQQFTDSNFHDIEVDLFQIDSIWTGPGKTGTQLVLTTDYELDSTVSPVNSITGETAICNRQIKIVNVAYQNIDLYINAVFVSDIVEADDVDTVALKAQVNLIKLVSQRQCILNAKKTSSGDNDALSFSGAQVSLDGATKPFLCTIANGEGLNGEENYKINITTNESPSEWLFTGSDASGRWQLFLETDGTVTTLGKTQSFVDTLNYEPSTPSTGDQYYNNDDGFLYEYSGSAWIQQSRLNIGSIDWDGSTTLSNIFNYDFKAVTKVDYTEYRGGGEYAYLRGSEVDVLSIFTAAVGYKSFATHIPVNTFAIRTEEWIRRTGNNAAYYQTYADNTTPGSYATQKSYITGGSSGESVFNAQERWRDIKDQQFYTTAALYSSGTTFGLMGFKVKE